MTASRSFDGAVLCGGASRRMGHDKATLRIDDEPMAARVGRALAGAGATTVAAVGGELEILSRHGLEPGADRWPGEGPLGGLVTALGGEGEEIVVVLGCDLVRPDPAAIGAIVDRLASGRADAAIPRVGARAQWLHGAWRRRVGGVLEDVFTSGERSLFAAVSGLRVDFVEVADGAAYRDADTPEALEGLR